MKLLNTSSLLRKLGYDFHEFIQDPVIPDLSEKRFSDLIPEIANSERGRNISEARLYSHQLKTLEGLRRGSNVVLISGSGSGKTEAWFLYTALERKKTLAIYPTLALANDQIERLSEYSNAIGMKSDYLDASRNRELISRFKSGLRKYVSELDLLVTNPAFLMHEIKKMVSGRSNLQLFIQDLDLLVIDEFDFYSPREISLLLSMSRIMEELSDFQIAILTATLGNPEDLKRTLTEINGKNTIVIRGKPFRPENRVYLIIGKNLRQIWEEIREKREQFLGRDEIGEDVMEALEDFDKFKENYLKVLETAKYLGLEIPNPVADPVELIKEYCLSEEEEGLTLVFTKSIRKAEEIVKRTIVEDQSLNGRIKAHHHLISREERKKVEEEAKKGELRVLVSPRTLAQGIDIGQVLRIVHIGLPETVREFKQREGRKGRRVGIKYTETVVFPFGRWDRDLVMRGIKTFEKWTEVPLEHAIVNPENKYSLLFESMYKFLTRRKLNKEEINFLIDLGLIRRGELTPLGERTWKYLNFYEFAPPYGIKRYFSGNPIQDIGHCDLVERFQIGCFDYSSDGIVQDLRRKGRTITGVNVVPIKGIWSVDHFSYALEEYEKSKFKWGEYPDPIGDYFSGRLHSEVICVVTPPKNGFGKYTKIPNRVYWKLYGKNYRPVRVNGKTLFLRDSKSIEVIAPTGGKYEDYTYGVVLELDPREDLEWIRVGLALLFLILRLKRGISFETIVYEVHQVGERKLMGLHEPQSAGILEKLDWSSLREEVREFEMDEVSEVLLKQLDEEAHYSLVSSGMNLELAKKYSYRVIDYLTLRERIRLKFMGRELEIPKPSRAQKLFSIGALGLKLTDYSGIVYLSIFDGEEKFSSEVYVELEEPENWEGISRKIQELVNKGFQLVVYDYEELSKTLRQFNLLSLELMISGLKGLNRVLDLREKLSELGISPAPFEEVIAGIGWEKEGYSLIDVTREFERSKSKISEVGIGKWRYFTKYLSKKAISYVSEVSELTYKLKLALEQIEPVRKNPYKSYS